MIEIIEEIHKFAKRHGSNNKVDLEILRDYIICRNNYANSSYTIGYRYLLYWIDKYSQKYREHAGSYTTYYYIDGTAITPWFCINIINTNYFLSSLREDRKPEILPYTFETTYIK